MTDKDKPAAETPITDTAEFTVEQNSFQAGIKVVYSSFARALERELAALSQQEGMVRVPREPTEEMVIVGNAAISSKYPTQRTVRAIYKAMLAAAPDQGEVKG